MKISNVIDEVNNTLLDINKSISKCIELQHKYIHNKNLLDFYKGYESGLMEAVNKIEHLKLKIKL